MRTNPSPATSRLRTLPAIALAAVLVLTAGCLYRMPVQQGNFLDPNQVLQLQTGMTRSQVAFLLGTPMVPNGFNTDRWDYYYYVKNGSMAEPITKRLAVYFKDDKVERFDRPEDTVSAAAAMNAANPDTSVPAVEASVEPADAPPPAPAPATATTPATPLP